MRRRTARGERGMVTAELAVGLPAVVLVLVTAMGGLGLVAQQMRCEDAASAAARVAARGEPDAAALAAAHARAPAGAGVVVRRGGGRVDVTVTGRRDVLAGLGLRPVAHAVLAAEEGATQDGAGDGAGAAGDAP